MDSRSAPPRGCITYLMTAVVGSTRLWERYPDAMRAALERHDALAATLMDAYGGWLVKSRGEGDSLFAVFPEAQQAVMAAGAFLQALRNESGPGGEALRVRIALHSGEADLRDFDYYGSDVNRCARLRSLAHGGQVLLSEATARLVEENLSPQAILRNLGLHRLRDLQRPEQVYQLVFPDLVSDFPPLRSLDTLPTNLPMQTSSFIGRRREMEEVTARLAGGRLVTLTGAGGCGKTRLALQVAAEMLETLPDGAWLVELGDLSDPGLVPPTLAKALGLSPEPGRTALETVSGFVRSRRMLIVLDNCEHLVQACARMAHQLLQASPHLQILATSREPLNIPGETVYTVPSLVAPDPNDLPAGEKDPASVLMAFDAVRLFVERASQHRAVFRVTRQNAPAVAQVCRRLDGIPLALELAAARVRALTVEQIAARLDDRFRLLTGGSRTALPRQQTLRALIDWSYDLLQVEEKILLHRLGVFTGGWTLEGAEAVCTGEGIEKWEVLDRLSSLVDRSLVVAEEHSGAGRYRLLETVRQYAREKLQESGGEETLRLAHRDWFLRLAEEAAEGMRGTKQAHWFERVEAEKDNMRAALSACLAAEDTSLGVRLAGALQHFWRVRGYASEALGWWIRLEQNLPPGEDGLRMHVLNGRADVQELLGDYAEGQVGIEEALRIARRMNDPLGMAATLTLLGNMEERRSEFREAWQHHSEALEIVRGLDDRRRIAYSLHNLGNIARAQGEFATAQRHFKGSLEIKRELGDSWGAMTTLLDLGNVARAGGDDRTAEAFYRESLAIAREIGSPMHISFSLNNLGNVEIMRGNFGAARTYYEESLAIKQELKDRRGIAMTLENLGVTAWYLKDFAAARPLAEESLALRRIMGDRANAARSLLNLANILMGLGDVNAAHGSLVESLRIRREIGNKHDIVETLDGFFTLFANEGDGRRAALLWGTLEARFGTLGIHLPDAERAMQEEDVAKTRRLVGDQAFENLSRQGSAMTLDQAMDLALEESDG